MEEIIQKIILGNTITTDKDLLIFCCPHCFDYVIVNKNEINCSIFRHGMYKSNTLMSPHESKEVCDRVVKNNEIYGCGKPFRILLNAKTVEKCDYI